MAEDKGLVSIIMLSKNQERYLNESIRSVINQTYTNWELLFVDDSSSDKTIEMMMDLKMDGRLKIDNNKYVDRIKVSQTVSEQGEIINENSALKKTRGKWIAFLNVGDVWTSDKLEKQIEFMEEHDYAFTYTQYRIMDAESKDRSFLISGKDCVSHQDMLKCCWPAYLTVMYNAEKVGKMTFRSVWTNYYALWINVSEKSDCYLLPEDLATLRTKWNRLGKIFLTNNLKWRYDAFRVEEDYGRITSLFYTLRNMWYGMMKWRKYVKRV